MTDSATKSRKQEAKAIAKEAHAAKMAAKKAMRRGSPVPSPQPFAAPMRFVRSSFGAISTDASDLIDRRAQGGMLWAANEFDMDTDEACSYDVHTVNEAGGHLCGSVSSYAYGEWGWHIYAYTDGGPDSESDKWLDEGNHLPTADEACEAAEAALARFGWTPQSYRQMDS